tara:strand:+ start:348 stop:1169 length:822 start_codon:yes stop_codon:yes gene_type:complete
VKTSIKKRKASNRRRINSTRKNPTVFTSKEFLIEFWQLICFSSVSIFLIFIYLNQAWEPINFSQIKITGLSGITKNDLEKATSIFFPRNLLELNPKELETYLTTKFPIKSISVSRKFFPPGINLSILEREPIAFASRSLFKEVEDGMIDIGGHWIPIQFVSQSKKNKTKLFVENWNTNQRDDITRIIKNRFLLESPLKKIKLNPIQGIIIETEYFDSVLLGLNTDRLIDQINSLNQLQRSLPNLLINTKVKIIDLKDPNKPELKTEKISTVGS